MKGIKMVCKYETCNNEAKANSAYCSNSCRAQHSRRNKLSVTLGATLEAQHTGATSGYTLAEGKAYNRPAVQYEGDQYATRPEPLNHDDQPHSGGRGKYTRADGTIYQYDSQGNDFEVTNGKVYQTTEDVMKCYV